MARNFEVGDIVEILDHAMFLKGRQFTIKNITSCKIGGGICRSCPGQFEFEEVPGNHCFGYENPERLLCKHADFKLELPL